MRHIQQQSIDQGGFSLIELMVGLVIGLMATLVIMQIFSGFEGQKRTTTGVADTQTNGSIALMNIQRTVQQAGYGLPLPNADFVSNSLRCDPVATYDPDGNAATLNDISLSPLEITDGGAGSDVITSRHSNTAAGAIPVRVIDSSNATGSGMNVVNNIGCNDNDMALIYTGADCQLVRIDDANGTGDTTEHVTLENATPMGTAIVDNARMACMGDWQNYVFDVNANNGLYELRLNGNPLVNEVVSMQAQYGVSASADSNQVGNNWVDATGGTWAAPTVENRNRIKAIRIAIVVRSGLLEKDNVSQACGGAVAGLANVCIWNSDAIPQAVNLNAIPNWQQYRYRVFETIIPLRNMLWSVEAVS